jgi:hypothetical protein
VKYPLAVNITGSGAPTESTEATTGMFYMDEDTGDVYKRTPDGWKEFNTASEESDTPYITPEIFGAVGDGVTDDTAAINEAIRKAADEPGVVKFSAKTYRVNSQIELCSNVTLIGDNTVLFRPAYIDADGKASGHRVFSIVGTATNILSNVTVDGFKIEAECTVSTNDKNSDEYQKDESENHVEENKIESKYKTYSNAYGFRIEFAENINVRNVTTFDCAYGLYIKDAFHVKISDCKIDGDTVDAEGVQRGGAFYGMYITLSSEVNVFNTYIASSVRGNAHHHDIYIGQNCSGVHFDNCQFGAKSPSSVSFKQGNGDDDCIASKDVCIANSRFRVAGAIAFIETPFLKNSQENAGDLKFRGCDIRSSVSAFVGMQPTYNEETGEPLGEEFVDKAVAAFRAVDNSTLVLIDNDVYYPGMAIMFSKNGTVKLLKNYFNCLRVLSTNPSGTINLDINDCVFDCDKSLRESKTYIPIFVNTAPIGNGKVKIANSAINMYNFGNEAAIYSNSANIALQINKNIFTNSVTGGTVVSNTQCSSSAYCENIALDFAKFNTSSAIGSFIDNIVSQV